MPGGVLFEIGSPTDPPRCRVTAQTSADRITALSQLNELVASCPMFTLRYVAASAWMVVVQAHTHARALLVHCLVLNRPDDRSIVDLTKTLLEALAVSTDPQLRATSLTYEFLLSQPAGCLAHIFPRLGPSQSLYSLSLLHRCLTNVALNHGVVTPLLHCVEHLLVQSSDRVSVHAPVSHSLLQQVCYFDGIAVRVQCDWRLPFTVVIAATTVVVHGLLLPSQLAGPLASMSQFGHAYCNSAVSTQARLVSTVSEAGTLLDGP